MSETAVMTTAEVADELDTDPKTLRKFFRSDKCDIDPVGQGKRYAITADNIDDLRTAFDAWSTGKAKKADDAEPAPDKAPKAKGKAPAETVAAKAARKRKAKKVTAPVVDDDPDEDLSFDEEEPTADALAELEDELDMGDDD